MNFGSRFSPVSFFNNPTVVTANNGVSIGGGAVVLGNNSGGITATLLSDREIPTAGFNINFSGTGNMGIGTILPAGRIDVESNFNNASTIVNNNLDGTQSSSAFRAMIGGANFTDFGSTGGNYNINPSLTATGFIVCHNANGFVLDMDGANAVFRIVSNTNGEIFRFTKTGNLGVGVNNPTALINIKGGTATAGTSPLKFTAGTFLTAPETGAMEFNGTNLTFTPVATRLNIFMGNPGAAAPVTSIGVAIANFYGSSATNFLGDPNAWVAVVFLGVTFKIPLYL